MTTFKVLTLSTLFACVTSNCMETATAKKELHFEMRIAREFPTDRKYAISCELMDIGTSRPIKKISLPLAVLKKGEYHKIHLTTPHATFHLEPVINPHLSGKTFKEQLHASRLKSIKY